MYKKWQRFRRPHKHGTHIRIIITWMCLEPSQHSVTSFRNKLPVWIQAQLCIQAIFCDASWMRHLHVLTLTRGLQFLEKKSHFLHNYIIAVYRMWFTIVAPKSHWCDLASHSDSNSMYQHVCHTCQMCLYRMSWKCESFNTTDNIIA